MVGIENVVALIGWPLGHSMSPLIQNAAFLELGLDSWIYVAMPVSKYPYIRIKEAILGLKALGFKGANITVPYKESVVPYLDQLSDDARNIGAVNTVVVDEHGSLVGHNTDGLGLIKDLHDHQINPAELDILLLGAGGSARSVAHSLLKEGCLGMSILNRNKNKADDIANKLAQAFPKVKLRTGVLDKDTLKQLPHHTLVINCTSLGMRPYQDQMPWDENISFSKSHIVYDLIYQPAKTKFLAKAEADGAKVINGLGMLVHQGALAFKLWTGHEAPLKRMKEAAIFFPPK